MFIVIDTFDPYYPYIVSDVDNGMPLLFDNREEAEIEAGDCQDAIVIEI